MIEWPQARQRRHVYKYNTTRISYKDELIRSHGCDDDAYFEMEGCCAIRACFVTLCSHFAISEPKAHDLYGSGMWFSIRFGLHVKVANNAQIAFFYKR